MNAAEFCNKKDEDIGEAWSNDYEELPKAMEEYHQMKLQEMKSKGLITVSLPVQKHSPPIEKNDSSNQ